MNRVNRVSRVRRVRRRGRSGPCGFRVIRNLTPPRNGAKLVWQLSNNSRSDCKGVSGAFVWSNGIRQQQSSDDDDDGDNSRGELSWLKEADFALL